MAVSEQNKVKRKDVSEGENLFEALENEVLSCLPSYFQDRSLVIIEPTQVVNLGMDEALQMVHLAQSLSSQEKEAYTMFLQEKKINFAWTYLDMLGLVTNLIMHHLSIVLGVKLVKQKLRKMHPHIAHSVKEKLEKLLGVKIIRVIDYVEWISNIVLVSKHEKTIQVCIDFRDVNRACPKDDFPLPNIDMIVDMIVGYDIYSLMDGFSRYNQIMIAPEDQ